MSGIFASLTNAVNALSAQQIGLETAGKNMANVNNANYARERVVISSLGTVMTSEGPESLGVQAQGVVQLRDSILDQQVTRETAITSQLTSLQSALQNAQAGLGETLNLSQSNNNGTTGGNGIAESLSNFFTTFTSLAANTTDVGERQTLLQTASTLTDQFQLTDSRLAQVQADQTTRIKSDVDSSNSLLTQIASLNTQISQFEVNNPGGATDLRDSRQADLESLAQKMGFETRPQPGAAGQIQVYTKDSSGNEILLVNSGSAATLSYDTNATTITATPAGGGPTATVAFSSGSIKGEFDARDTYVAGLRTNLDNMAKQLVTSVNSIYDPSGTNSFFTPTGTTAATIQVDPSVTAANLIAGTGSAGDNSIALGIANLANHTFSTAGGDSIDGTFSQYVNNTVTGFGQTLSGVNSQLTDQQSIQSMVTSQRDAVSGVSLDEEMTDLMKYQRAYQASSRMISTLNSLLDTVVNLGK